MKVWQKHAIIIAVATGVMQFAFIFAPPDWFFQILVLTMSTNLTALVYAVWAFKTFEDTTERLKPVFTSRLVKIIDRSYEAMSPKRQAQLERNLEQFAALAMVYVDRVGEMSEEQFGEFIGRTIGVRLRVTPEDLRTKIRMVSGY